MPCSWIPIFSRRLMTVERGQMTEVFDCGFWNADCGIQKAEKAVVIS